MKRHSVLIVGAGPAGLCAALTLQRRGVSCLVLERVSKDKLFADVGGGYDVGLNSLKMLDRLGVGAAVRAQGRKTSAVLSFTSDDALYDRMTLPQDVDAVGVLRSTLQRIFLDALDPALLRCQAKVVSVASGADGVLVTLEGGEQLHGEVLVAADGAHSAVRRSVFPQDPPLQFCGLSCAWGRTPLDALPVEVAERMPAPDEAMSITGPGRILLAGCPGDGWLWSAFWRTEGFAPESVGALQTVQEQFADWGPRTKGLLRHADPDSVVKVGIFDRDPVPSWTSGRSIVIGDAAHPMTPFLGQGANSAMIDAFILANLLVDGTPESAFEIFEARRKAAMEKNVASARSLAGWMTTENRLSAFAFRTMMRLVPSALLLRALISADEVNDVSDLLPRIPEAA